MHLKTEGMGSIAMQQYIRMDFKVKFKIPELSDNNKEHDEMRPNNIEFDGLDVLRNYISKICEDPAENLHAIEAWSKDFKPLSSSEFQNKFIDITLIHFPEMSKKDFLKGYEFLVHFSGNTLFLMEQGQIPMAGIWASHFEEHGKHFLLSSYLSDRGH